MKFKALLLPFLVFPFLFACNNNSLKPDFKMEVEKDGFVYSLIGDEIEIHDYIGNAKELIVPSHIDGYPVTSVELWGEKNEIKSIVFSEGIKTISEAMYGTNLSHVSLPNSLVDYDGYFNTSNYNEYENGLYLGNSENPYLVFCGLKDETVTSCSIKEGTKFLRDIHSESLVDLTIPDSIVQIHMQIFIPNVKLNEYENGLYLGNEKNPYHTLIKAKNKKEITKLVVHKNTKIIYGDPDMDTDYLGSNSFGMDGCESLTEVVLPNGLKRIMDYAFASCDNLKTINFPKSLVSIGTGAFTYCSSLESIILPSNMTHIGGYAFYYCIELKEVLLPKKIKIIDDYTFAFCQNLESITIPNSVYYIGEHAFSECENLKEIKLGNKLIAMNSSFQKVGKIEELIIPNSFKYFFGTFSAESVKHLQIGKSVTYYPYDEDYDFDSIRDLNIELISVSKDNKTFDSRKNCNAIIDKKTNELVFGIPSTKIPDTVTSIAKMAFFRSKTFEHIDIPDSVTKIGDSAFAFCTKIESVFIPKSVLEVGEYIFNFVGHDCEDFDEWFFPYDVPLKVYCEAESKPEAWNEDWDVIYSNGNDEKIRIKNVIWGATRNDIPKK